MSSIYETGDLPDTVEGIVQANAHLKVQLETQLAIFEQYMEVAKRQNDVDTARQISMML